jgi:hypothetical protein
MGDNVGTRDDGRTVEGVCDTRVQASRVIESIMGLVTG